MSEIKERIRNLFERKLLELNESNVQKFGRTKVIKVRVRGGKVQRRKKFSTVPGYTIRGGRLVRMSSQEIRKRKLGARRAKVKRKGKLHAILRKRRISLRRRASLGVR
jgi:hypothetical protein